MWTITLFESRKKSRAMTILEMLIVVVIMAVIAMIALPSYYTLQNNMTADAQMSTLKSALLYARAQALKNNVPVTVCKSQDKKYCGGQWSEGLLVFLDTDNTHQVTKPENILRVYDRVSSRGELSFQGFSSSDYLQISPTGLYTQQNGTFVYCAKNKDAEYTRSLVISNTGRIRETKGNKDLC